MQALFAGFLERLRNFRVLDPACGSGNFLYLALKCLKDIEHQVNLEAEALGLQRQHDMTGPHNVHGIELNEFAADLVCDWFEKCRALIETGVLQRAGLVSTNSIRGGKNRVVLDRICEVTRIFEV